MTILWYEYLRGINPVEGSEFLKETQNLEAVA